MKDRAPLRVRKSCKIARHEKHVGSEQVGKRNEKTWNPTRAGKT